MKKKNTSQFVRFYIDFTLSVRRCTHFCARAFLLFIRFLMYILMLSKGAKFFRTSLSALYLPIFDDDGMFVFRNERH